MAEIKTGIFAKNVQKRLNRAQEKVLQKLGKADETKDEQFEQVVINFRRQESEGSRLQREMKAYMSAIKGMQQASINLTQSLHEVYEPDWHGKDDIMTIGKDCDALWEDFHNKVVDSTLLSLDAYLQQFPDLKTRVSKRSRKLIDYDSARHHVETLQASGMKNDRKMLKAEEELKKAQKVFDELNAGLQDELPTLWDSRVGFYISTYKSVTNLEAKFHREISAVHRQLYEVMTKLGEQHSDKMFTIQGAPSDSGPLRLARTPSPPEDESPPESPDASSNNMLRPVSPGPPRPKSPIQGPPVPPPPKVTPTKEVAEEQIIDLFGGEFLPAPSPSQPNERPGESLLDLDFDAFQPDESVSPIPQTAVPWDMWSANTQAAQPAAGDGFIADWSADFGSVSANGDAASGAKGHAVSGIHPVEPEEEQGLAQGGAEAWQPGIETDTPPQDSEAATAAEDEVSTQDSQTNPNLHPTVVRTHENESERHIAGQQDRQKSTPGLTFTNECGEQIGDSTEERRDKLSRSPDGSGSEYETAEEWGDGGQAGGGWASAEDELSYEDHPAMNTSERWVVGIDGVAANGAQTVMRDSEARIKKYLIEEEQSRKQKDLTSVYREVSQPQTGRSQTVCTCETQGGGAFDSVPLAETQGGGAFDSAPLAETQSGDAFDSDPFAETQRGRAFESTPLAETPGGGAFDSAHLAERSGGGAFASDPFAETQRGGAFESTPLSETQGEGAFDFPPLAETQGGGAFDPDPFAETQGGGAFDPDPFAETQGGGAFDSDPFAETQGGGAFDLNCFSKTNVENKEDVLEFDPFAETSGEGGVAVPGVGRNAWDADHFANSFPAASTRMVGAFNTTSWQEVSDSSDFKSSVAQPNFVSMGATAAEGIKDVNISRIPKEPENSDMSDDEAANRRYGKLYQELDTEKEEDAAAPTFFADFDKMNKVNVEATEVPETSEIEGAALSDPAEEQNKLVEEAVPHPPGEQLDEHPAGEVVERSAARPDGEEAPAETCAGLRDDKPASNIGSPSTEKAEHVESSPAEEAQTPSGEVGSSEKMPIPSVVIEPASSNEGDDDRDVDIISPSAISDNGVPGDNQGTKHITASGVLELPDDFLYKVQTMHDFEAANPDELELKRGDIVLVIPTASAEDQDAGWLTGIKESDWLTLGVAAQKGLFPENFTQRFE